MDRPTNLRRPTNSSAALCGLPGARRTLTAGVRLTARLVEVVELLAQGRRAAVAVPMVSLVADLRLLGALRDPQRWPGWADWLVDGVDVGIRSAFGHPDRADELPSVVADVIPTGVMAGFEAASGRRALPVVSTAPPWPPAGAAGILRTAAHALGPLTLVAVGHAVGATLRGRRARPHQLVQPAIVSTSMGFLLARQRDRLQERARAAYRSQLAPELARERDVVLVNARTAPGPGHDFAKTLVALGQLGDEACEAAGRRALDTPRRMLEGRADGAVLRSLLGDLPIDPPDGGRIWLDADQVTRLREQLARVEDTATDGADQTIRIRNVRGRSVELDWLGQTITVQTRPPHLRERFHTTATALAVGATYKLLPVLSGVPAALVLPAVAIDGAAAWNLREPQPGDPIWPSLAWSTVATVVQTALTARARARPSEHVGPPVAATANCTGAALVWSSQWGRLTRAQRAAAAVPLTCWLSTMVRARPLGWHRWVIEACYLAMPAIAVWRLTDRLDEEAELLARSCHEQADAHARSVRAAAEAAIRDDYRCQLAIARAALARFQGRIPDRLLRHFERDCAELEVWLAEQ